MPVPTVVSAEAPEINIPGSSMSAAANFDGFEAGLDFWPGADSAVVAEHQFGRPTPTSALYAAAGRSRRFAPPPVAGYEYDGHHRMPAVGSRAGGRAGRRRRPDVRLDLPGGQYGREPRGTGVESGCRPAAKRSSERDLRPASGSSRRACTGCVKARGGAPAGCDENKRGRIAMIDFGKWAFANRKLVYFVVAVLWSAASLGLRHVEASKTPKSRSSWRWS